MMTQARYQKQTKPWMALLLTNSKMKAEKGGEWPEECILMSFNTKVLSLMDEGLI